MSLPVLPSPSHLRDRLADVDADPGLPRLLGAAALGAALGVVLARSRPAERVAPEEPDGLATPDVEARLGRLVDGLAPVLDAAEDLRRATDAAAAAHRTRDRLPPDHPAVTAMVGAAGALRGPAGRARLVLATGWAGDGGATAAAVAEVERTAGALVRHLRPVLVGRDAVDGLVDAHGRVLEAPDDAPTADPGATGHDAVAAVATHVDHVVDVLRERALAVVGSLGC